MASYGNGFEKVVDEMQPQSKEVFTRLDADGKVAVTPADGYLGVHKQPQEGCSRVGVHVPAGRLSVVEARQLADVADKYCPKGEIRLTVEQNVIFPNVPDAKVAELLAEPCLNGDSRLSVKPGNIVANLVSCTGAQFCGLAMIETKHNAETIAKELEARMDVPNAVRIHWTGCPNSCGQVQAADIGLMGGPAKKMNDQGQMKAVPGVKIFVGGTIGETGKLALDETKLHGGANTVGVASAHTPARPCPKRPFPKRPKASLPTPFLAHS